MLNLQSIHHIAIICSDYQRSKKFYTEVLGLKIIREVHREERQSYKLDLELNGLYVIELFSFPTPLIVCPVRKPAVCDIWLLVFKTLGKQQKI